MLSSQAVRHANKNHQFDGKGQRSPKPKDYQQIMDVLSHLNNVMPGELEKITGNKRFVVVKKIGSETYRLVFEVFAGKKNRNIRLVSFVIKTK